jgi:hypothetical protein
MRYGSDMNGVKVSSERFKSLLEEKGINGHVLARQIDSTDYQMYRIKCGRYTTSFRFLDKLVPVFGLQAVCDIIADEGQSEAFMLSYIHNHPHTRARRKAA